MALEDIELNIPFGEYMPKEYSQELFRSMAEAQQRSQQEEMRQFIEGINAMGQLYTGSALRKGVEQVLTPRVQSTQEFLRNIALTGPQYGRKERLGELEWGRKTAESEKQRGWEAEQFALNRELQRYLTERQISADKRSKSSRGFLQSVFETGLGGLLGKGVQSLPTLLGL